MRILGWYFALIRSLTAIGTEFGRNIPAFGIFRYRVHIFHVKWLPLILLPKWLLLRYKPLMDCLVDSMADLVHATSILMLTMILGIHTKWYAVNMVHLMPNRTPVHTGQTHSKNIKEKKEKNEKEEERKKWNTKRETVVFVCENAM